jgi:deoxyribonuclease IV
VLGSGTTIGSTLEELADIRTACQSARLRVCIDTAHAFARGYDLSTPQAVHRFVEQVDQKIGWQYVAAIHLNDSKVPLGKRADRHENIGEGQIGSAGLQAFMTNQIVATIPCILEVPGKDKNGPDKDNIQRVRQWFT